MTKAEHYSASRFAAVWRHRDKVEYRPGCLAPDCFFEFTESEGPVAFLSRCFRVCLLWAVRKEPVRLSSSPAVADAIDEAMISDEPGREEGWQPTARVGRRKASSLELFGQIADVYELAYRFPRIAINDPGLQKPERCFVGLQ